MLALNPSPATPWLANPFRNQTQKHLFGDMYEDPAIELQAFAPLSRVFCIASAGCTARALSAAGHAVTAVDINPQQILYARARAAGAPARDGVAEELLSQARRFFPLSGWTKVRCLTFLSMRDPSLQLRYWRRTLNSKRWRLLTSVFLSRWMLGLVYTSEFAGFLPRRFASLIRARLERTWNTHSNASNPYAWRLLLGARQRVEDTQSPTIHFVCADALVYLEQCEPGSFDAFSLSNITDGAPKSYGQRLWRAVQRAAAPGAVIVTRSFSEPRRAAEENLARCDRSMLWGTVYACKAGDLCSLS